MTDHLESCTDCRFFVAADAAAKHDGTCHRHAPMQLSSEPEQETVDAGGDDDAYGTITMTTFGTYFGWPGVLASDWCGEWEARR